MTQQLVTLSVCTQLPKARLATSHRSNLVSILLLVVFYRGFHKAFLIQLWGFAICRSSPLPRFRTYGRRRLDSCSQRNLGFRAVVGTWHCPSAKLPKAMRPILARWQGRVESYLGFEGKSEKGRRQKRHPLSLSSCSDHQSSAKERFARRFSL